MPTARTCPACGFALDDAAGGACPRCALGELLAPPTEPDAVAKADDGRFGVVAAPAPTPTLDDAPERSPRPARVGRYKVLQLLGEGGFGTVFMAEQEHPVRRTVALKIIKLGMDTRQVIARFEAERQALALMDHPNIAKVLDAGATETGRPYFVMELVKGIPITQYCDQARLTPPERLELFVQVCQAVQHAHQKGIIHRDLKPSNVLVALHDGKPVPKVIDFGIAKATQGRLTEKTLFTEQRQMIGTPEYMSPEQAELSALDVDTRSDVYSLGVLLYELLTGTTPFDPRELRSKAYGEIQRIIREVEPPHPSTRLGTGGDTSSAVAASRRTDPRKLRQMLRGDLDWIVMKCLEKERSRRYETATGLAADVKRYLSNEPVQARPVSAVYRIRKWALRHKAAVASGAAVVAALVLGLAGATYGLVKARLALIDANEARSAERERSQQLQVAKAETTEKLRGSYLAQAQAGRWSGRLGRRFSSLEAIRRAAEIRPGNDLRDEAIACLALVDLKRHRHVQAGHPQVAVMGFDRTLDRYASCDERGNITIRDAKDDRTIAELPGRGKPLSWGVFFSPDGRYLVAHHDDGTRVWDLSRDAIVLDFAPAQIHWFAADFSPDSSRLAVGHPDGTVSIHDVASGQTHHSLPAQLPPAALLRFQPGGKLIAALVDGGHVHVRDVTDGRTVRTYKPCSGRGLAWHPEGNVLAVACQCRNIHVFDLDHEEERFQFDGGGVGVVERVAFSPSGKLLASTGWDNFLSLWDVESQRLLLRTPSQFPFVQFSRDGSQLVSGGFGHAHVWEVADGQPYRTPVPTRDSKAAGIDFGNDESWFAASDSYGVHVFDARTLARIAHLPQGADDVLVTPDQRSIVTGSRAGGLRWPIHADPGAPDRVRIGPPEEYGFPIAGIRPSLSPDGRHLAVGAGNGNFLVLDPLRPDEAREFGPHPTLTTLAVSPDGRWVAAVGHVERGPLQVWDLRIGRPAEGGPTLDQISKACFSPDGRQLATCGMAGLDVWEVGSWRRLHSEAFEASTFPGVVEYARDADLLAFTLPDGTIRLREASTFRDLATIRTANDIFRGDLRLSRGGAYLARMLGDGRGEIWNLREIRRQLAGMGLDWPAPAYPMPGAPPQIVLDEGRTVPAPPLRRLLIEARSRRREIEVLPDRGASHAALGRVLLRLGRFEEAVEPYRRAIELEPGVQEHPYRAALLALYLGDRERYHLTCDAMFDRFKSTADPFVADRTAKTCLVGLSPDADARPYVNLLGVALRAGLKGDVTFWFELARGMGEHRSGRDQEAVAALTRLRDSSMPPQAKATAEYFIAMSLRRLRKQDEATAAFASAEKLAAALLKPGVDDLEGDGHWVENWLVCQIVRREATTVFALPDRRSSNP